MPIVFVHGVAVRDQRTFQGVEVFLRRYVAPKLNPARPDAVTIVPAFWGDEAARFAWRGRSRPRTALLGKGTEHSASTHEQALMLVPFADDLAALPGSVGTSGPARLRAMGPGVSGRGGGAGRQGSRAAAMCASSIGASARISSRSR